MDDREYPIPAWVGADLQDVLALAAILTRLASALGKGRRGQGRERALRHILKEGRQSAEESIGPLVADLVEARAFRPIKVRGRYYPCAGQALLVDAFRPGRLKCPEKVLAAFAGEVVVAASRRGNGCRGLKQVAHSTTPPAFPTPSLVAAPDPAPKSRVAPALKRGEILILCALASRRHELVTQKDITQILSKSHVGQRSIMDLLRPSSKLMAAGYVERPNGEKSGTAITEAGVDALRRIDLPNVAVNVLKSTFAGTKVLHSIVAQ